jgi:hypothetical protein
MSNPTPPPTYPPRPCEVSGPRMSNLTPPPTYRSSPCEVSGLRGPEYESGRKAPSSEKQPHTSQTYRGGAVGGWGASPMLDAIRETFGNDVSSPKPPRRGHVWTETNHRSWLWHGLEGDDVVIRVPPCV